MGHQDKGQFAAKHKGRNIIGDIANKIKSMADNGNITCSAAHQISKSLNQPPSEIGIQIDLLELRIIECQLGLFGYSNGKKKIDPNIEIPSELDSRLETSARNGKISCVSCWDIASNLKIKRLDLGSACEKKNIRIKPCQLGSF